jgi:hypothetical protein
MTVSECRREIEQFLSLLTDSEVAIRVTQPLIRRLAARDQRVTWPDQGSFWANKHPSWSEYRAWIEAEAFSAVLFDGALLQCSFDFHRDRLSAHRLVYFPCPFRIDPALFREEPILDVVDLFIDSPRQYARLVTPLRFDYDAGSHNELHPASHLTLISSDCRWAVTAPISLGHFIRFVFSHFYPTLYESLSFTREWRQEDSPRTIRVEEERFLHITCARHAIAG